MNYSSLYSVPESGLQVELELASKQSCYGIMNASSWADQQHMIHQEQQFCYFGGETMPGWLKESLEWFSSCTEPDLLDSGPMVSSDRTLPLLRYSFQNYTSSSSNLPCSPVVSDLNQPPLEPELLFPFEEHEFQQQEMNYWSLCSVAEDGLQMEFELPSNQSCYGIMNASLWEDQQHMIHQISGMNQQYPLQNDVALIQSVTAPEPAPIPGSNYGTMVINGSHGINTDWSIDCSLSLHNAGVNLNSGHPTAKRIRASEDVAERIDGCTLSLEEELKAAEGPSQVCCKTSW